MRILIAGDTHGNINWLAGYIFPTAMALEADRIVICGDFGAWEHVVPGGTSFMTNVGMLAEVSGVDLYWLPGNHDNKKLVEEMYRHRTDRFGFIVCRSGVNYIPNGHKWVWGGAKFRSFGGAYSIDKQFRLSMEQRNYREQVAAEQLAADLDGRVPSPVASTAGTIWFPDEEMTDAEMDALLKADSKPKDIILSHDKPLSAEPGWNKRLIAETIPNQERLERALKVHKPKWWIHGHLHYAYDHVIRQGSQSTRIIGLEPDANAAERNWRPSNTWVLLDVNRGFDIMVTKGHARVGKDKFQRSRTAIQVGTSLLARQ